MLGILINRCWQAAQKFAPTLCCTAFDGNGHAINGKSTVGGNNLIHAVRFSTWVKLWAIHLVAKSCNGAPTNIMGGRTADDSSAVVGFVAHRNDHFRHSAPK